MNTNQEITNTNQCITSTNQTTNSNKGTPSNTSTSIPIIIINTESKSEDNIKVFETPEEEITFYHQKYNKFKMKYNYYVEIHQTLRKDYSDLLLKYETTNDELKIEQQLRRKYEQEVQNTESKYKELRNSVEKEKSEKKAHSNNFDNNAYLNNLNSLHHMTSQNSKNLDVRIIYNILTI